MVGSLMRSFIGSIMGFAGTEAVGLTRPAQFGLALTAQAEFIICNQSIDEDLFDKAYGYIRQYY